MKLQEYINDRGLQGVDSARKGVIELLYSQVLKIDLSEDLEESHFERAEYLIKETAGEVNEKTVRDLECYSKILELMKAEEAICGGDICDDKVIAKAKYIKKILMIHGINQELKESDIDKLKSFYNELGISDLSRIEDRILNEIDNIRDNPIKELGKFDIEGFVGFIKSYEIKFNSGISVGINNYQKLSKGLGVTEEKIYEKEAVRKLELILNKFKIEIIELSDGLVKKIINILEEFELSIGADRVAKLQPVMTLYIKSKLSEMESLGIEKISEDSDIGGLIDFCKAVDRDYKKESKIDRVGEVVKLLGVDVRSREDISKIKDLIKGEGIWLETNELEKLKALTIATSKLTGTSFREAKASVIVYAVALAKKITNKKFISNCSEKELEGVREFMVQAGEIPDGVSKNNVYKLKGFLDEIGYRYNTSDEKEKKHNENIIKFSKEIFGSIYKNAYEEGSKINLYKEAFGNVKKGVIIEDYSIYEKIATKVKKAGDTLSIDDDKTYPNRQINEKIIAKLKIIIKGYGGRELYEVSEGEVEKAKIILDSLEIDIKEGSEGSIETVMYGINQLGMKKESGGWFISEESLIKKKLEEISAKIKAYYESSSSVDVGSEKKIIDLRRGDINKIKLICKLINKEASEASAKEIKAAVKDLKDGGIEIEGMSDYRFEEVINMSSDLGIKLGTKGLIQKEHRLAAGEVNLSNLEDLIGFKLSEIKKESINEVRELIELIAGWLKLGITYEDIKSTVSFIEEDLEKKVLKISKGELVRIKELSEAYSSNKMLGIESTIKIAQVYKMKVIKGEKGELGKAGELIEVLGLNIEDKDESKLQKEMVVDKINKRCQGIADKILQEKDKIKIIAETANAQLKCIGGADSDYCTDYRKSGDDILSNEELFLKFNQSLEIKMEEICVGHEEL